MKITQETKLNGNGAKQNIRVYPRLSASKNNHQLIQAIHDTPHRVVWVAEGTGVQGLNQLLEVSGTSRTLIEGIVPYSTASIDNFLGRTPKSYVAQESACLLAGCAYRHAVALEGPTEHLIGIGCTGSIASDRPKKGEHRAYIAVWQPHRLDTYYLHLEKGVRDRVGEEELISDVMLHALAEACGVSGQRIWNKPLTGALLKRGIYDLQAVTDRLLQSEIDFFGVHDHGRIRTTDVHPQTLLSGSFNPLHKGHLGMAAAASKQLGVPIAFELSARNVDKPPLPADVLLNRIIQFAGQYPIYVSNAPTYMEKARLYPGATFVVGYDTAVRIFAPRYYGNSEEKMVAAIEEIRTQGCDFLVAGRLCEDGIFRSLADIAVPAQLADMFRAIPDEDFRMDISSTELRNRG